PRLERTARPAGARRVVRQPRGHAFTPCAQGCSKPAMVPAAAAPPSCGRVGPLMPRRLVVRVYRDQLVSITVLVIMIGVDSAYPNMSGSLCGPPGGGVLTPGASWYSPRGGWGGEAVNLWWTGGGLPPPVIETVSGPAISPVIRP